MIRNLGLGALAALALTFSPFVSRASADWQSYYDQLSKLKSGESKLINIRSETYDKQRAADQKLRDNNIDAIDKARASQAAWIYWHGYPNYYGRSYGYGSSPWYNYQVRPAIPTYSPGSRP